jgi:hypothetical protein
VSYGISIAPLHGVKNGRCTCGDGHCERPGKHPRTKRGLADATTDPKKVERLWAKWPNAKIGVVMGAPANLIAVEARRKTGRQKLREIMATNGTLPRTPTIWDHDRRVRLFRLDENQAKSGDIAEGVRILGDGDVIVAPSRLDRKTGKHRFAPGRAVGELKIAQVPNWLIADLGSAEGEDGQAESTVDGKHADRKLVRARHEPIPFHPFANIFPMLGEDRLHELAQDIKDHGLLESIVRHEGQILDGRGRFKACNMAGYQPEFQDYVGNDPLGYVVSRNLRRRHLTESQRAMVAAKVADLKRGANQHSEGLPIGRTAHLLNVGERTVARAKEVMNRGVPELVSAVERGQVAVSAAAAICRMPESEQRQILGPDGPTEANGKARTTKLRKLAGRKTGKPIKPNAAAGDMVPAAEADRLKAELAAATERVNHLERELKDARASAARAPGIDTSVKATTCEDIPPFLDRRPFPAEDQLAFDAIKAAWDSHVQPLLQSASAVVRERFNGALRAYLAGLSSAAG